MYAVHSSNKFFIVVLRRKCLSTPCLRTIPPRDWSTHRHLSLEKGVYGDTVDITTFSERVYRKEFRMSCSFSFH